MNAFFTWLGELLRSWWDGFQGMFSSELWGEKLLGASIAFYRFIYDITLFWLPESIEGPMDAVWDWFGPTGWFRDGLKIAGFFMDPFIDFQVLLGLVGVCLLSWPICAVIRLAFLIKNHIWSAGR